MAHLAPDLLMPKVDQLCHILRFPGRCGSVWLCLSPFKAHVIQPRADNSTKGLLLLCRLAQLINKALGPLEDNRPLCTNHAALHHTAGWVFVRAVVSLLISPSCKHTNIPDNPPFLCLNGVEHC